MAAMVPGLRVLVGSAGTGDIQVFALHGDAPALESTSVTSTGHGVSFLSLHPRGDVVYATHSHDELLTAFVLDPEARRLQRLNETPTGTVMGTPGTGAVYATVDATGRFLLVASYHGHTVSVWSLEADGRIGAPVQSLSDGQHAHCVRLDPSNRWAFVPFLGSDCVAMYRFDQTTGQLTRNEPASIATAPGAGPRHIDLHPTEPWLFLINELDGSLYRFDIDRQRGTLRERQRLDTLPAGYDGRRWAADIHVAPSGQFIYVSNRAHDSIAIVAMARDGTMTVVGHQSTLGRTPRNFTLGAGGNLLLVANQDSDTVALMTVDAGTGTLHPVRTEAVSPRPYIVCVLPGSGTA